MLNDQVNDRGAQTLEGKRLRIVTVEVSDGLSYFNQVSLLLMHSQLYVKNSQLHLICEFICRVVLDGLSTVRTLGTGVEITKELSQPSQCFYLDLHLQK